MKTNYDKKQNIGMIALSIYEVYKVNGDAQ